MASATLPRSFCRCALLLALLALAAAAAKPDWVAIASPHFTVVTDGSPGQARDIAAQLERLRAMLRGMVPGLQDPPQPIEVLAVKKKKEFVDIVPPGTFTKNSPDYVAYTITEPERNLYLLRLDAINSDPVNDSYPFGVIYASYVGILLQQGPVPVPDWLREGLGNFYYTAQIHDHDAEIGRVQRGFLQDLYGNSHLYPLDQLFTANLQSAFWNEQDHRELFDAESWALVHMLLLGNGKTAANRITPYFEALVKDSDSEAAARAAYGDLNALQRELQNYTGQLSYRMLAIKVNTRTDPKAYGQASLPPDQADALRAEYMIACGRYAEARLLLDTALQQDPHDVAAMESMGYLEWQQNNLVSAAKWYGQAAPLDPGNYLTQYRFAQLSEAAQTGSADPGVEAALRRAVQLNPNFAPAYDALASRLVHQRASLDEADGLERKAIALSPSNFSYRLNYASILMDQQRLGDAIAAAKVALQYATNSTQTASANMLLQSATSYQQEQAQVAAANARIRAMNQQMEQQNEALRRQQQMQDALPNAPPTAMKPGEARVFTEDPNPHPAPTGPPKVVSGTIQAVYCTGSNGLDLTLDLGAKTVLLHTDDYFKVAFSVTGFTPKGLLQPCRDLEGLRARVSYVPGGSDPNVLGAIVGVQLSKAVR